MRHIVSALILTIASTGAAFGGTYSSRDTVSLGRVLPPPPSPESEAQKRDIQKVLDAQSVRTAEESASALQENDLTVFQFAAVLGPDFSAQKLPRTAALFKNVLDDSLEILGPAKEKWHRPRPFATYTEVSPAGERPKSASYPSGNSLLGYVYAIILSDLLPERHDAIFAKGLQIGDARVIAGVHYPTDVAAGRLAAVEIASTLARSPAFAADFAAAKSELQTALVK